MGTTHRPDRPDQRSHGGSGPEEDRDALIQQAARHAPEAPELLALYYRHVPAEDILGLDPAGLAGTLRAHLHLAAHRVPGRPVISVRSPEVAGLETSSEATVVQIVTDDMPYLVDSITSEFARSGVGVHRIVHPIVVVSREVTGALRAVNPNANADAPPDGTTTESWMYIELDRIGDPERLTELTNTLDSVISDVREVVEDTERMTATARELAGELRENPPPLSEVQVADGRELLEWIVEGHFTFLGYRRYEVLDDPDTDGGEPVLRAVLASGLGVLRRDSVAARSLTVGPDLAETALAPTLLVLTAASAPSTVHRPVHPYYIGVKTFDAAGAVTGEHRFLGMFTTSALHADVLEIPVVDRKVRGVIHRAGFPLESHSGQRMLEVLQEWPRAELFSIEAESLYHTATGAITLADRRRVRLFLRTDQYQRFYSCLVFVPRERYSTQSRQAMQEVLLAELDGRTVEFATRLGENMLAQVHFTVYTERARETPPDTVRLQELLNEAVRGWVDHLVEAIVAHRSDRAQGEAPAAEEPASDQAQRYAAAFPEGYKEDFPAAEGLADLRTLQQLERPGDVTMRFYVPEGAAAGESRFKIYLYGAGVTLSALLPMLQTMGVVVVDQRPYDVDMGGGTRCWIYDFGLRMDADVLGQASTAERLSDLRVRFQDAFAAAWHGRAEVDGFNALVLCAGLDWRQASVLRAYARYLRQAGTPYSQEYIEYALRANSDIAARLVRMFETKFALGHRDAEGAEALHAEIGEMIDAVASLDEDRILRRLLLVITATLRTNYFVTDDRALPRAYLSFKLDPQSIPDLPQPRPPYEIYVYSPRVEGVHLRFGAVARGGLRWSDRREDFRTEVLALVKAQAVKNAVIVPVGAKGGFVVKRPPASSGDRARDRDALQEEGIACYRMFISGMLDLTDNLEHGTTVPARDVVRYDGDDSYLVVAADKGTATFSDIANEVAVDYGFWLGDAFASGGSTGYDHKLMGITAKGAWESVKRHFRERGVDVQSEAFTVVGIGDMAGDVFGNGMQLSEHIKLIAAFNHLHIFVDPHPDPAASLAERQRLFHSDRSTWDDYDRSVISPGGEVFSRDAKSVDVSAQMREALGLDGSVGSMTPTELIRAILLAPVDLFWNGGIGTYVKASAESHAEADDKANDSVRVNGADLRVKVVGEGGNLGLTQRGRIEFARAGGSINTDALDNSGGVDSSDHEVNFKILLDEAIAQGALEGNERNSLLASMTDEVGGLVLANNYAQNAVLGVSRKHAPAMVSVHQRQIGYLEAHAGLDRELEALPGNEQFAELEAAGSGLASPELAGLLAHAKLHLADELLASKLPDQHAFTQRLPGYFPPVLRERFGEVIHAHPLKRQIITTLLVNEVIDGAGLSYAFRLREEMHAEASDAVRAFAVVAQVYELPSLWRRIDELDGVIPSDVADELVLETRRLLDRASRWLLSNRPQPLAVGAEISRFSGTVARLAPKVAELARGQQAESIHAHRAALLDAGVPVDVADRVAVVLHSYGLLDVTEVAELAEEETGPHGDRSPEEAAELYYALAEHLGVDRMLSSVSELERGNRWHALARLALRDDIYYSLRAITLDVFRHSAPGEAVDDKIEQWEARNASRLSRARVALDEIHRTGGLDLATLSVAVRQLRSMTG